MTTTFVVCRSPVLPPSPSARPASHRSWKPAAAAFPASVAVQRRRLLPVTQALPPPEKHRPAFSIPPTALLNPIPPVDAKERWDIKEEKQHVSLWFQVPGLSENDLDITVSEDMLEIKRKGATATAGDEVDVHGIGSFHVRLLLTKEYDGSGVTAELKAGMLELTIRKAKDRRLTRVGFGPRSNQIQSPPPSNTNTAPRVTNRNPTQNTN